MRIQIIDRNPKPWKPEELATRLVDILFGREDKALESPTFTPRKGETTDRYQLGMGNDYRLHIEPSLEGCPTYHLTMRYGSRDKVPILVNVIGYFCHVEATILPLGAR